jgi:hypothetical protein
MVDLLVFLELFVDMRVDPARAPHNVPVVPLSNLNIIRLKYCFDQLGIRFVHLVEHVRGLVVINLWFLVGQQFDTFSINL